MATEILSDRVVERVLFTYGCRNCPVELYIRGRYATVGDAAPAGTAIPDADLAALGHPDLRRLAGRGSCPVCGEALYFKREDVFLPDDPQATEDAPEPEMVIAQPAGQVTPGAEVQGDTAAVTTPSGAVAATLPQPPASEPVAPEPIAETPAATPAAAAHAEELGVDLSTVEGSGKDGTITKSDVAAAAQPPAPEPPAGETPTETPDWVAEPDQQKVNPQTDF